MKLNFRKPLSRKTFLLLLAAAAVLVAALVLLAGRLPDFLSSVLCFPLEPVAGGLKRLAGTGSFGNGLAAALWIGLSVIPAAAALRGPREKSGLPERVALLVFSGMLALGLYGMMNPQVFCHSVFAADAGYLRTIRTVFATAVWAALALYIGLRLIRLFRAGDRAKLLCYLGILLHVLCVLFTAEAVVSLLSGFAAAPAEESGPDCLVRWLHAAANAVPWCLDIAVILRLLDLAERTEAEDPDRLANTAGKLSRLCTLSLGITVVIPVVLNTVQILLMPRLTSVSATAEIPVISIVLVALILLVSRLLVENRQQREESSLFI